jgi:protein SMG6
LKAKALAPKSSRAYHQLAILAVYTKRRLDACYYYFRCLEVNIPLTSVKQALNSIFDEARVKSDAISKFINNAIQNKQQKNAAAQKIDKKSESSSHRIETWYLPSVFTSNQPHSSENKKTIKNIENNNRSSSNNNSSNSDTDDSDNDDDDDDDGDDDDEQENDYDDDDDQNDHKKLSTLELNKRFMHNYLNTIGKLFTKVGMESYYEVCSRMLYEFKELLRRKPCPLQKIRLLQITIINISVIDLLFKMQESQQKKTTTTTGFIQRNQLVENAVQLGIDMFVLISKRFTNLLSNYYNKENLLLNEQEADESMKTWRQFFPSIKIFIDWMLCNSKLWQPFPDQLPPDLGPILNRWQIICDMLNLVNKLLNNNSNQNNNDQISSYDIISGKIKLEEDLELVGFVPLLSLPCEFDPKIDKTIDLSHLTENHLMQIRDKKRMEKLCLFADYLCGLEQPYLKYDVVNKCYCPIIISNINNTKQIIINKRCLLSETNNNRTSICSNNSSTSSFKSNEMEYLNNFDSITLNSDPDDNNFEENNNFSQLKEKHRILKEKRNEQEKQNKINVLDHLQRQIELEIRPKFIVPDTNCFVDHLDLINKILTTNYYILVVPLLVINELDKLSKSISNYNDDSLEHAQYVQRSAKKAIQYLNEKFDKRDRNIKAITSQGSVLETIQFRSEELKAKGTNDELILGCCLHFVHDNARDFNKSDRIYLYREIVLLTEDRHLRLKSHTRNVPVKNILHFCRWSHLLLKNENNNNNNNNSGTHHGSYMFNKNKSKQKNGKNNFKQKNKIPNK